MRIMIVALSALLLVAGAAWWWRDGAGGPARPAVAAASTGAPAGPAFQGGSDFATFAARGARLESEPASWRGTEPDGALRVDDNGDLIVTEEVRRRFDYFLSALGEEDLNVLRARVAAHLDAALPPAAARQAWDLFERYTGYRAALRGLDSPDNNTAALRRGLEERRALRRRWFDAEAREAFFGFRDRYDSFALDRRAILEDPALSAEEKAARVSALEADLAPRLRAMVEATRRPVSVAAQVDRLREQGASEARVYQLRERELGAEAAERLADLDHRRAEWERRYDEYREQREGILHSGLAPEDRDAQVRALRARLFDQQEQRRVQALDRIR
ncbi:lipase secretion chaperone [Alloalcanivorax sp. C16-2]|uniref:lipase secretion chaperone n=1 Tax=Alloalcanivorax sp. C16-2 TaxID=3390052 RepID=UPI0039710611